MHDFVFWARRGATRPARSPTRCCCCTAPPGTARNLLQKGFAEPLYGPGQPLDLGRLFLVLPDGIGAGGSSKPSDGLHARFPHYGYRDQVRAQHDLLGRIGVTHLKLVLGTSMGGMQTWLWGEMYPDAMDALVAIAATPAAIRGRNMIWRAMVIAAIRADPGWKGGDYPKGAPPHDWIRTVAPLFAVMTGNAEQLERQAPDRAAALDFVAKIKAPADDPDDLLYSFESSADYDPAPRLGAIRAPVLAINFADDLLNPPELLNLPRSAGVTAVMLPGCRSRAASQRRSGATSRALPIRRRGAPNWRRRSPQHNRRSREWKPFLCTT